MADDTPLLVLASGSVIRADLLRRAGLPIRVEIPRVDEEGLRDALLVEQATPREIADALAEMKAARIAAREPRLVLGCDQVLALGKEIFAKPATEEEARAHLSRLSGRTHRLLSAAVLYENGAPVWRHVGEARLTMRELSPGFIADYTARNWNSIRHAVGCYKLEEEGVRLFTSVEGSYFTVLGLPLLELIDFLIRRGTLVT